MQEKHWLWDLSKLIALSLLTVLFAVYLFDARRLWQKWEHIERSQEQLSREFSELRRELQTLQRSVTLVPADRSSQADAVSQQSVSVPDRGSAAVQGEEGDWLVMSIRQPNSLNPMIDNDAFASELFLRAHDPLASRSFEDLQVWEPRLATHWKQELWCYLHPHALSAAELVEKIKSRWSAEDLNKRRITACEAQTLDGKEQVCIKVDGLSSEFIHEVNAAFKDRIEPQWWYYLGWKGQEFADGTLISPESITQRLTGWLQRDNLPPSWKLLPLRVAGQNIVLRILGAESAKMDFEKQLDTLLNSNDNMVYHLDQKELVGKRLDRFLALDQIQRQDIQIKPVFEFELDRNARWHDGKPVTGNDVIFTHNTRMNPLIAAGPGRSYYQDCEAITLVGDDPYKIRFVWFRPYFDAWAVSATLTPMAEHHYRFTDPQQFNGGNQNQVLVGNGAYRFVRWEKNREIVFVRNENYHSTKPFLRRLVYKVIPDPTMEMQLLEKGDLDLLGLTPDQMRAKQNGQILQKNIEVDISIANSYRFIGWNARTDFFGDRRIRQAMTLLLDRDYICTTIMRGFAVPLHGPFHPENAAYWPETAKQAWPHDPDAAVRKLEEAGWRDTDGDGIRDKDGKPFRFTLLIPGGRPEIETIANYVRGNLEKAGIVVRINSLEWGAFLQRIEQHQFDACILGWQLSAGESDPFQLWHSSQVDPKESNFCYFVNKEADRLIEEARSEIDPTRRYPLLHAFQKIIVEEQPYTFLFVSKRLMAYDRRLQNVRYKLHGTKISDWWVPAALQKYRD